MCGNSSTWLENNRGDILTGKALLTGVLDINIPPTQRLIWACEWHPHFIDKSEYRFCEGNSFHRNILSIREIRNLIQSYTSEQQRNRPSKGSNVSKKQKWGQEVDIKGKYSLEDHKSKFHTEALRSQQRPADIVCRSPEEAEQTQTVQMWELWTFLVNVRWNMHALHSTLELVVWMKTKMSISRGLLKI